VWECGGIRRWSLASFRQKTIRGGAKNGNGEALEGFWRGRDGFVSVLRDVARRERAGEVLRGLKKGPGDSCEAKGARKGSNFEWRVHSGEAKTFPHPLAVP